MIRRKILPLLLCLALAACATQPSPDDEAMADSLATQGKALLAKGKYAEALDIYLSATSRNDQNPRVWNGLGVSYEMLGKRDLAREAYEKALNLTPGDKAATNNLAHLLIAEGEPDQAVGLLASYKEDGAAPKTLKQNLAKAVKEAKQKESSGINAYAELGSAPTEGMAKNRIKQAKSILGSSAEGLAFHIVPEVKVTGGTPVFSIRITGRDAELICEELNPLALPCFVNGE